MDAIDSAQLGRSTGRCGLERRAGKATGARRGGSVPAGGEGWRNNMLPVELELELQNDLELKHSDERRPARADMLINGRRRGLAD
jgi:hypothetical protein